MGQVTIGRAGGAGLSRLENIENLVKYMAGKLEALIDEREEMRAEIVNLRQRLMERDKEAVKASHDMRADIEAAKTDALRLELERQRDKSKLHRLNERLIALAEARRGG